MAIFGKNCRNIAEKLRKKAKKSKIRKISFVPTSIGQLLAKFGAKWMIGVREILFFSLFSIFPIQILIKRVKSRNLQMATEIEPIRVERWLSPFWNRHDEYFHVAKNGENLRVFSRHPPPYPLKGLYTGSSAIGLFDEKNSNFLHRYA